MSINKQNGWGLNLAVAFLVYFYSSFHLLFLLNGSHQFLSLFLQKNCLAKEASSRRLRFVVMKGCEGMDQQLR